MPTNQPSVEEKERIQLYGLVIACPFDQENPTHCSLHAIRKLSRIDRFTWIKSLAPTQISLCIAKHKTCLCKKNEALDS